MHIYVEKHDELHCISISTIHTHYVWDVMQRVDDTDSRLIYTPPEEWHIAGVEAEFMHSTHWTTTADAQMVFQFKGWSFFKIVEPQLILSGALGTKVSVFGTISSNVPQPATLNFFSVDDREPVSWSVAAQKPAVYKQLFFSSPTLEDGVHTLTMNVTVSNSQTFIDYLEFEPSQPSSIPLSSSSTSTSSATSDVPIPTTSVAVQVSDGSLPAGAVAGISVVATLAVISGLGCLWWWWRRRRHKRRRGVDSIEPHITPQDTPYPSMSNGTRATKFSNHFQASEHSGTVECVV
ncbi:hypothetical protein AAF712_005136 [Marasmius tenuissimus]|uniref:Uncharacterized protein n=1 Tax=Marasmius tenuissimus TaxID=585030 RepID=A0ABR3A2Y7_9AGAR